MIGAGNGFASRWEPTTDCRMAAHSAVLSARPLIERVGLPPQLADEANAVATAKHAEASARAPVRALWAPYGWHELDAGNRSTLLRVRSSPLVSAC